MVTVQQVIDQLSQLQDKSQELTFQIHNSDSTAVYFGEFHSIHPTGCLNVSCDFDDYDDYYS